MPDWAGGTRIGENLKAFNDVWGRRALTRGAVVVIASDGWERGDPALLGSEMARLQRAAHTRRLGQPARRAARATGRSSPAWRRRSRTSTSSCPGTT